MCIWCMINFRSDLGHSFQPSRWFNLNHPFDSLWLNLNHKFKLPCDQIWATHLLWPDPGLRIPPFICPIRVGLPPHPPIGRGDLYTSPRHTKPKVFLSFSRARENQKLSKIFWREKWNLGVETKPEMEARARGLHPCRPKRPFGHLERPGGGPRPPTERWESLSPSPARSSVQVMVFMEFFLLFPHICEWR